MMQMERLVARIGLVLIFAFVAQLYHSDCLLESKLSVYLLEVNWRPVDPVSVLVVLK